MQQFENLAKAKGFSTIAGIDEAGRGPLAGPVVSAAVILPQDFHYPGITDSKKLSEKKREALYDEIKEKALAWAVSVQCKAQRCYTKVSHNIACE